MSGTMDQIMNQIHTSRPLIITVQENLPTAMQLLKEEVLVRTISVRDQEIVAGFDGDVTEAECELLRRLVEAGVKIPGDLCARQEVLRRCLCRLQITRRKRWRSRMKTNPVYKREIMVSARSFKLRADVAGL
ncbi:MAG: hypothetical protein V8S27_00335 [Lachnospiraceae bacterium]